MSAADCVNHPGVTAGWECEGCSKRFCDQCIHAQQIGLIELKTCTECGGRCLPLTETGEVDDTPPELPHRHRAFVEKRSFFELLPGAFIYPFAGSGIILLVIGAMLIAALPLIQLAGLFGLLGGILVSGYLAAYLIKITQATANGDEEMPDWPSFSDIGSDIIAPYFLMLGATLICFLPLMFYVVLALFLEPIPFNVFVAVGLLLLGLLYFPGGLMAAAIHDCAEGLNPSIVIPAIFRLRFGYVITCVVLLLMVVIRQVATMLLSAIPVAFVPGFISGLIAFYFAIVQMRILGLLYRAYEKRLRWFDNLIVEDE